MGRPFDLLLGRETYEIFASGESRSVKPNGLLGAVYMAAIMPFRHLIVYPPLMRDIEREWQSRSAFGLGVAT